MFVLHFRTEFALSGRALSTELRLNLNALRIEPPLLRKARQLPVPQSLVLVLDELANPGLFILLRFGFLLSHGSLSRQSEPVFDGECWRIQAGSSLIITKALLPETYIFSSSTTGPKKVQTF